MVYPLWCDSSPVLLLRLVSIMQHGAKKSKTLISKFCVFFCLVKHELSSPAHIVLATSQVFPEFYETSTLSGSISRARQFLALFLRREFCKSQPEVRNTMRKISCYPAETNLLEVKTRFLTKNLTA